MANQTNKDKDLEPYDRLVPPYPVWAATLACGILRKDDDYKDVASELFQDDYETCINLDDTALYNYHKAAGIRLLLYDSYIMLCHLG